MKVVTLASFRHEFDISVLDSPWQSLANDSGTLVVTKSKIQQVSPYFISFCSVSSLGACFPTLSLEIRNSGLAGFDLAPSPQGSSVVNRVWLAHS
jgi:hypothetical protein